MNIAAEGLDFKELNQKIRRSKDGDIFVDGCCGERFIGAGLSGKKITLNGTPGNGAGAYLDGAQIIVNGNAQDAVGDTMNDGKIIIHGNAGDALGYAMRGGRIYVKGDAGYRTGIQMKEYKDKKPVIVIGGTAGSFLGEYLAGGIIIILGLNRKSGEPTVGEFVGVGMYGGKIFIREDKKPDFSNVELASASELEEIAPYLKEFSDYFSVEIKDDKKNVFYVVKSGGASAKRIYV
jgi:glutamate synthase domain-containing protein 3